MLNKVWSRGGAVVAAAGFLVLSGCFGGGIGHALTPPSDNTAYTRLELMNPLLIPRKQEVVVIPLSEVRESYQSFDPEDFSVHLFDTTLYPHGDPLLATNPPPEVPSQLSDRSLDGELDTLLLLLDFEAGEKQFIAVCSPRFSVRTPRPEAAVVGGLMRRSVIRDDGTKVTGEGAFTLTQVEVVPHLHTAGDGLYFLDGVVMESEETAFLLSLDERLSLDVVGKRRPGFQLMAMASYEEDLQRAQPWGARLIGAESVFGAGALACVLEDVIVPLGPANSIQYRLISSGPVAAEVEILLNGVRLGEDRFDVKWNILHYAGSNFLVHRARVSDTGHALAFAVANDGRLGHNQASDRTGWMRTMSFGPRNVAAAAGGSLGLGILSRGGQCLGHAKALNIHGVRFNPMVKEFSWVSLASWSEQADGPSTLEEFRAAFEEQIRALNNPVRARNIDFRSGRS